MSQQLPASWVEKIFARLLGIYGRQFSDKFSRMVGNIDAGMENAKRVWSEELAGFTGRPEAIAYALKCLDPKFPPSALEFCELCRRAPRNDVPALPHKPTADERQHQHEMAARIGEAIGAGKIRDGIDEHWETHPRSAMHLRFIFDAAKRDARFSKCIAQMVADGICSEDGRLLRSYANGAWQVAA